MPGRAVAISLSDALRLLDNAVLTPAGTEIVGLLDAKDRVSAIDITAMEELPGFCRSTMDGYAVLAADTFGASDTMPVYLTLTGEVLMGNKPDLKIIAGKTAKIPTGGMLPEGSDAVVLLEHSQVVNKMFIEVNRVVVQGENVIQRGEDVKTGQVVIRKGSRLRPQDIGALAGVGITEVEVFRKPVVAIIATGNELVAPDKPYRLGQVRDVNTYNLYGMVKKAGGTPLLKGIIKDDYAAIMAIVQESRKQAQMVIITGGSSVGTMDMTARILDAIGNPGVLFHGVAIKPGKSIIAGVVDGTPMFGLPGHPAAVTVGFDVFAKPVLRKLAAEQLDYECTPVLKVKLTKSIPSVTGRVDYIWVRVFEQDSEIYAEPVLSKAGLITTLVKSMGVIVIPADSRGLSLGDNVSVTLF